MDEPGWDPAQANRSGSPFRWAALLVLPPLAFAAGILLKDRIFPEVSRDAGFAKALRSPTATAPDPVNSLGVTLHLSPSGVWLSHQFVTAGQFEKLTGSVPKTRATSGTSESPDRSAGEITHAEAAAFCRMLTDREKADAILPPNFRYRLPLLDEISAQSLGADEWLEARTSAPGRSLHVAAAVLELDASLYAPDCDSFHGGWTRWHANILSGPSGVLRLSKAEYPKIELAGIHDGIRRRLTVRATSESASAAADLANIAAAVIRDECNARARLRSEAEFVSFRSHLDAAEAQNARERSALLDLMARFDIADTLDLPSWFLAREDLQDDLGIQNAKNNIERLKNLEKQLVDSEDQALPDLAANPGLSDAVASYLRLLSERKLLEVQQEQLIKSGSTDSDPHLVALRSKIARNVESLQVARASLIEDVSRELKVAENLLVDLQLVKRRRAKEQPPPIPTDDQPREEAVLESRIAHLDQKIEQLGTLRGDTLYDYALVISERENPLRALIPEYIKHRELAKEIQKAIRAIGEESEALAKQPIGPNAAEPGAAEPGAADESPEDAAPAAEPPASATGEEAAAAKKAAEEAEAKARAEKEAAEKKAAELLAKLTAERESKLKAFATAAELKRAELESAESDKKVAEEAVIGEIATLIESLTKSREADRRELGYLIAKRKYLVGWYRLVDLRAELAVKKAAVESPPNAAMIVREASADAASEIEGTSLVPFAHQGQAISAQPGFRHPDLHFRLVLERVAP